MSSNMNSDDDIDDEQMIENYLDFVDVNKSQNWYETVRRSVKEFYEWLSDDQFKNLDQVDGPVITDHITHLKREGYVDSTIRTRLGAIREMLKFADRRDWIDVEYDKDQKTGLYTNEIKLSSQPKKAEIDDVHYISQEKVNKIIDACDSLRDRLLLTLLIQTGVRASQAADIKIGDLDRDNTRIDVDYKKQDDSDSSYVYYQSSLEPLLYEWIDLNRRNGRCNQHLDQYQGNLFVTNERPYMSATQINRMVRRRADDADVQEIRYVDASGKERARITSHTLRHSFAVHRLNSGMPIKFLKEIMQHNDIRTTEEYLEVDEDDIKEAYYDYLP